MAEFTIKVKTERGDSGCTVNITHGRKVMVKDKKLRHLNEVGGYVNGYLKMGVQK